MHSVSHLSFGSVNRSKMASILHKSQCMSILNQLKLNFKTSICKRFYHENVIDHYENPRNVGSLDKNSKKVGKSHMLFFS